MTSVADLTQKLQELHLRTVETPLFNPVFQLAHDLSRQMEAGEISLDDIEAAIAELEVKSLEERSQRLKRMVAPLDQGSNEAALAGTLTTGDFAAFQARWQHPNLHAVFTAHPTFLLTPDQSAAVAASAVSGTAIGNDVVGQERPQVTLMYEHGRAMQAIAHAQEARNAIVAQVLTHAQSTWPDRWHELAPLPFRFASWVGYDMDGRTDIKWSNSIGFRLSEKAEHLERYLAELEAIDADHALLAQLRPAVQYATERAQDFSADLSDPAALSLAANRLTASDPHKLLSLTPFIDALEAEAAKIDNATRAVKLKTLAAAMRADGLGMGWIHFRVNAKQLHNAIRRRIDPDGNLDLASKGAVVAPAPRHRGRETTPQQFRRARDRGQHRHPPIPCDGADPPAYRRRCADPHVDRGM